MLGSPGGDAPKVLKCMFFHSAMSTLHGSLTPEVLTGLVALQIALLSASDDFVGIFGASPSFNFEAGARNPPNFRICAFPCISTCIKRSAVGQDKAAPSSTNETRFFAAIFVLSWWSLSGRGAKF